MRRSLHKSQCSTRWARRCESKRVPCRPDCVIIDSPVFKTWTERWPWVRRVRIGRGLCAQVLGVSSAIPTVSEAIQLTTVRSLHAPNVIRPLILLGASMPLRETKRGVSGSQLRG